MRVLIITRNAWDDTNSIGNTFSNFFAQMHDVEFANIYFRSARPNNHICKRYYRVTEIDVLKHFFSPQKMGEEFIWDNRACFEGASRLEKNEKKLIHIIHKHGARLIYKLSDRIWYSRRWLNGRLASFVQSFKPDVMVSFVKSAPQYYCTIKYLKEEHNIPLVLWIADDEYSGLKEKKMTREIDNLRYLLKTSTIVRGCSEEICEYYNSLFHCGATPLYKGCDLSQPIKERKNDSLKIIYAGNLLYGRMEIIKRIIDVLEEYVTMGNRVSFEIYSNTTLSTNDLCWFRQKSCAKYLGKQSYETIKQQLLTADMVLHAESFNQDQMIKTQYSFSTKIIDCLQCGSVLLAVGPKNLSSVEYVRKIPGAYVIDDLESLQVELMTILEDASSFHLRSEQIREFAKSHHEISQNTAALRLTLIQAIKDETKCGNMYC